MNLTPELIAKLDQHGESPEVCAKRVWDALASVNPNLTNYDLQCFAVQILAAGVVNSELKYAEGTIRLLNRDFYYAHYLRLSECLTSDAAGIPKETISDGSSKISRGSLRLE